MPIDNTSQEKLMPNQEHAERVCAILENHGLLPKSGEGARSVHKKPYLTKEGVIVAIANPQPFLCYEEWWLSPSNPLGYGPRLHIDSNGVTYLVYHDELVCSEKKELCQHINAEFSHLNEHLRQGNIQNLTHTYESCQNH
jgi:hypothetical protein